MASRWFLKVGMLNGLSITTQLLDEVENLITFVERNKREFCHANIHNADTLLDSVDDLNIVNSGNYLPLLREYSGEHAFSSYVD
jgi:hypothetical protein